MSTLIPAFVEYPQHWMTVAWGDRQLRIRQTWRQRNNAWFLDIFDLGDSTGDPNATGSPIVLGRRISPRFAPLLGIVPEGLPLDPIPVVDGGIGSDPYARSDLGETIRLLLISRAEVAALRAAEANSAASLVINL
jgi:hypothetical protein